LEAGQSAIISLAILTANLSHLREHAGDPSHLFSALLALPYLAVNLGLLVFNLHPARVFVGDTFCYFAGMTFAVNGILGHMAWTLPFFFLPQIVNFAYSLPQLFKVYPCPRHRLPDFDAALGLLRPSSFELPAAAGAAAAPAAAAPTAAAPTATRSPRSASAARRRQGKGGGEGDPAAPPAPPAPAPRRMYNMTRINLLLRATGPLHERTVTNVLLALQAVCCAAGLYARVLMRVDA
jgi:UDP-N-acetylglucosamine--dolichyl-phosphate N-acetylglucosaminephosphotransferase